MLKDGAIGGAALDVTDPEPLPDGHPLWDLALITPHIGNTPEMARPLLSARITENVHRFATGEPLLGPVDPAGRLLIVRVTGIDHVVLPSHDVERSVAWYRDRLGLEPVRLEEWRQGDAPFVSLRIDATTIIDLFAVDAGQPVNTGGSEHVALVVEGVDLDDLDADEWDLEMGPTDLYGARGVGRGVYLRDPDGHRIELRTY